MRLLLLVGMGHVTCLLMMGVGLDIACIQQQGDSSGCGASSRVGASGQQRQ